MPVYENLIRRPVNPGYFRVAFTCPPRDNRRLCSSSPFLEEYRERLSSTISELACQGYRHFLCAGLPGIDMLAAECVVQLREEDPGILLEMVSSSDTVGRNWSRIHQRRREMLFEEADIVTVTGHVYHRFSNFYLFRYLADNADLMVASGEEKTPDLLLALARQNEIMTVRVPIDLPEPQERIRAAIS